MSGVTPVLQVFGAGYARPARPLFLEMAVPDKGCGSGLRYAVISRSDERGLCPLFLVSETQHSPFTCTQEIVALVNSPTSAQTAVLFPNSCGRLGQTVDDKTQWRHLREALKVGGFHTPPDTKGPIKIQGAGAHSLRSEAAQNITKHPDGMDNAEVMLNHTRPG